MLCINYIDNNFRLLKVPIAQISSIYFGMNVIRKERFRIFHIPMKIYMYKFILALAFFYNLPIKWVHASST